MGKGSKKKSSADVRPVPEARAAPVPATEPPPLPVPRPAPAIEASPRAEIAPAVVASPSATGLVEGLGEIGAASVRALQAVLPTGRAPLALLGAGLLVIGVVELPVVVGVGLAYEALRRWDPPATPPPS